MGRTTVLVGRMPMLIKSCVYLVSTPGPFTSFQIPGSIQLFVHSFMVGEGSLGMRYMYMLVLHRSLKLLCGYMLCWQGWWLIDHGTCIVSLYLSMCLLWSSHATRYTCTHSDNDEYNYDCLIVYRLKFQQQVQPTGVLQRGCQKKSAMKQSISLR